MPLMNSIQSSRKNSLIITGVRTARENPLFVRGVYRWFEGTYMVDNREKSATV
jgi:hypothetical protein